MDGPAEVSGLGAGVSAVVALSPGTWTITLFWFENSAPPLSAPSARSIRWPFTAWLHDAESDDIIGPLVISEIADTGTIVVERFEVGPETLHVYVRVEHVASNAVWVVQFS